MNAPEEIDFIFDEEPDVRALPPMRATKLTKEASGARVEANLNAKISGEWFNIPFPNMPQMSQALPLVPGSVFGMCGGSKVAKSFLLMQWVWQWIIDHQIVVRMLALESGCEFHADRMFAQMAQNGDYLHPDKLRENPELAQKAREDLAAWRACIDHVAPNIQDMSDNPQTVGSVLAWMEREFEGGLTGEKAQIVIVDPVTAIEPDRGQRFADHYRLIRESDRMARKHGARVILSTHPIRSKSFFKKESPSLDRIANGQCYGQFCSAVGWIEYATHGAKKCDVCKGKGKWKDQLCEVICQVCKGAGKVTQKSAANREFHWLAVRNAVNPGRVPMNFSAGSLTYSEVVPE